MQVRADPQVVGLLVRVRRPGRACRGTPADLVRCGHAPPPHQRGPRGRPAHRRARRTRPPAGSRTRSPTPRVQSMARIPTLAAMTARTLVVKVTAGADAPERCAQAFTVAATAVAAGVAVSLWLTGESAWFALPGRAETVRTAPLGPAGRPARRGPGRRHGDPVHPVRRPPVDRGRAMCCPASASPARRPSSRSRWPTAPRPSSTDSHNFGELVAIRSAAGDGGGGDDHAVVRPGGWPTAGLVALIGDHASVATTCPGPGRAPASGLVERPGSARDGRDRLDGLHRAAARRRPPRGRPGRRGRCPSRRRARPAPAPRSPVGGAGAVARVTAATRQSPVSATRRT